MVLLLVSGLSSLSFSDEKPTASKYELLGDTQACVRRNAVAALGNEGREENLSYVIRMLKDVDLEVQKAAISAIVKYKKADVVKPLEDAFNTSKENDIKMSVISALGDLNNEASVPFLKELLKSSYPHYRNAALRALGKIDNTDTYLDIVDMLSDQAEGVRVTAAKITGNRKIDAGVPQLVKDLSDPVLAVRLACIESLGEIGDSSVASDLKKLLADQNKVVVETAQKALDRLEKKTDSK
jgi:HEAT repeat protein